MLSACLKTYFTINASDSAEVLINDFPAELGGFQSPYRELDCALNDTYDQGCSISGFPEIGYELSLV